MNIKRIILAAVLAAGLISIGSPSVFADDFKIGYVDLSRLFDQYYKTQNYDKTLEEKSKGFESERNDKIEKIREAQGKLDLLKEDKRADLQSDIEQMKADLLEFDRQQKADLTKERNEKIREILLEIEKIVSNYAEKEHYNIILNDRVLIYGNPAIDLTQDILSRLNAGHPVSTDTKSSDMMMQGDKK